MPERAPRGPGGTAEFGYEWVATCPVEVFIERVRALRHGERPVTVDSEPPRPANALRALRAFALMRPIDELITAAPSFADYRDKVNVLAAAALCRSVTDAAELAGKQWEVERGADENDATPLTDGIVHEVACQRTVLDVAQFVGACRREGRSALADKTVAAFTDVKSGRTNLDRALFYIALRDERGCGNVAADLLYQTLAAIDSDWAPTSTTAPAQFHDLVGALRHLSPAEAILEEWIDTQYRLPGRVDKTSKIVARLIVHQTDSADMLVEHVGRRLYRRHVVDVCRRLATAAPERCAEIREQAARRANVEELAEIVSAWRRSEVLSKTTRELLADIVEHGPAGAPEPRSLDDIETCTRCCGTRTRIRTAGGCCASRRRATLTGGQVRIWSSCWAR